VFEIAYKLLKPGGKAFLLMLTHPRPYISWWFTPLARLFRARYVEQGALSDLPGLRTRETWSAGLASLVCMEKTSQSVSGK